MCLRLDKTQAVRQPSTCSDAYASICTVDVQRLDTIHSAHMHACMCALIGLCQCVHCQNLAMTLCRGCSAADSLDGVLTPYVQACSISTAEYAPLSCAQIWHLMPSCDDRLCVLIKKQ